MCYAVKTMKKLKKIDVIITEIDSISNNISIFFIKKVHRRFYCMAHDTIRYNTFQKLEEVFFIAIILPNSLFSY